MLESLQLIHIYISSILHIVFSAKTFTIQAEPALIQICLHVCLQEMDDLFGSSGVGSAPEGTVRSTSLFPHQQEGSDSQEQTTNRPAGDRPGRPPFSMFTRTTQSGGPVRWRCWCGRILKGKGGGREGREFFNKRC